MATIANVLLSCYVPCDFFVVSVFLSFDSFVLGVKALIKNTFQV